MPKIHVDYQSGNTAYFVVRNESDNIWYPAGAAFEVWGGGAGRTKANYNITLTDKSGNRYSGDFPSAIPAGRYSVQAFLQVGASPADDDPLIGSGPYIGSGSAEITTDKLLKGKAVQTKSTGAVVYYDDDGVTPILTQTPTDAAATITRTPS